MRSLQLIESRRRFETLQRSHSELRRFHDQAAVLDYFHARSGDLDDKDRLLAVLVAEVQAGGRGIAMTMLWLALWPALDGIYRRLLRHFRERPDELVSAISERFTLAVLRADLTGIRRLAATLVRNVERDIRQDLRRVWAERSLRADLPDPDALGDVLASESHGPSRFGLPPGAGVDAETAMLRELLARMVGADADLVVAVVVLGEGQDEAAGRLGIGHEAARKRFQRALRRIREGLEED
jgi:RNA polymerase sigma-70 factor (ECF subfamily)